MKKIKLTKPLWNCKKDDVMEVSTIRAEFAIRKGKAIEYIEPIEPKKAEMTDYKNKIEPEAKKLRNKSK